MMIAIIDQGINTQHSKLSGFIIEEICVNEDGGLVQPVTFSPAANWHGTNISVLIHSISPESVLLSIKLLGATISVKQLCSALEFCAGDERIRAINISLGILTERPNQRLREACFQCYRANKIIVAAAHLDSKMKCYPAAFSFVYGVGIGLFEQRSEFSYLGEGYINVLAKGTFQRLIDSDGHDNFFDGTSYASACFTGIVSKILESRPRYSKPELDCYLQSTGNKCLPMQFFQGKSVQRKGKAAGKKEGSWLGNERAILFPTDDSRVEELVVQFTHEPLVMQYPVNPNAKFSFKQDAKCLFIPAILSRKLFTKVNTLVVGNFLENDLLINRLFGYSLIKLFLDTGFRISFLDNHIEKMIADNIESQQLRILSINGKS